MVVIRRPDFYVKIFAEQISFVFLYYRVDVVEPSDFL